MNHVGTLAPIALAQDTSDSLELSPFQLVGAHPLVKHLVTEDDTPVDNLFSAKQQRLLVDVLYSSWQTARRFLADENVGLFYTPKHRPIVPDAFLSLDVQVGAEWWEKRNRSYFFWELGKPPEIVFEIVSNTVGQEDTEKMLAYAGMGIMYYVIYDPLRALSSIELQVYRLGKSGYRRVVPQTPQGLEVYWLPEIDLGVQLWEGIYQGLFMTWVRWCDAAGQSILTGAEHAKQERLRADQEHLRADQERLRADQERLRAEQAHHRAERFAARLRELGIDPEQM